MIHVYKGITMPLNAANIFFTFYRERNDGTGKADVMLNCLKKLILFSG